ncbi:MAG: glycosyltransferase [Candidatus Hydrogenedentes bacterium]|nr:glycosyltransferase [Candidatus Hydrogenedentota bacterium]
MRITLQKNSLDLSVVIPTLNEGPNLYRLLPRLKEALEELRAQYEILVIDAHSQDGTESIVNSAGATYIFEEQPGYGNAIIRGLTEAKGTYVLTMDADLSHPADFVKNLWGVREDADITIASRYVPGGHAEQPLFRLFLSRVLNIFYGKGLSIRVKDLSSGYRLYRKNIFSRLDLEFTNFVLLIDILLKAHGQGFAVQEVAFHYKPRGSGSSKARILKFGLDYLRLFCRVWKIRNAVRPTTAAAAPAEKPVVLQPEDWPAS